MNTDWLGTYRATVRKSERFVDEAITHQKLKARDGDPFLFQVIYRYYIAAVVIAAAGPLIVAINGMSFLSRHGFRGASIDAFILTVLAIQLVAILVVLISYLKFDGTFSPSHRWQILGTKIAQTWLQEGSDLEKLQTAAELDIAQRKSLRNYCLGYLGVLIAFAGLKKSFVGSDFISSLPQLPLLSQSQTFLVTFSVISVAYFVFVYVRLRWSIQLGDVIAKKAYTQDILKSHS